MRNEFRRGEEEVKEREKEEEWTAVLSLDHIRSRNRYIGLLERWTQQLQLTGRLLLGPSILVILQGARPNIKVSTHMFSTASHKDGNSFCVCPVCSILLRYIPYTGLCG